jgi:hypothetical protein
MDKVLAEGRLEGNSQAEMAAELGFDDITIVTRRFSKLRVLAGDPPQSCPRRWERSEEERLLHLYQARVMQTKIADELKRSEVSIRKKLFTLRRRTELPLATGLVRTPRKNDWTAGEKETLTRMREDGVRWEYIAAKLGRSQCSCIFIGNQLRVRPVVGIPWSSNEDARLKRLYPEHGRSWKQIVQHFPGRTEIGVRMRVTNLGLLDGTSRSPRNPGSDTRREVRPGCDI